MNATGEVISLANARFADYAPMLHVPWALCRLQEKTCIQRGSSTGPR